MDNLCITNVPCGTLGQPVDNSGPCAKPVDNLGGGRGRLAREIVTVPSGIQKKRENGINNSIPVYTCNTLIYIGFLSLAPYVCRGVLKDISIDTSMTQVR